MQNHHAPQLMGDINQRSTASQQQYGEDGDNGSFFNQEGMEQMKQNFGDGEFQPEMFVQNQENQMPNEY